MRISDWSSDVCSSDLLARPTIISDGQFTPDGKTLTLSLEDADAADFAAALRRGRSAFDPPSANAARPPAQTHGITVAIDRKSVVYGKSVSVRVDLGGRRSIKKKSTNVQ